MGIIGFLAVPLGYVMRAIYGAVQNYGVAIILFTALVKVCLLPLTIHQQKSTAKKTRHTQICQIPLSGLDMKKPAANATGFRRLKTSNRGQQPGPNETC